MFSRVLYLSLLIVSVCGHGRLLDPPSRSSMWRFGYNTPRNYNDNELFCGGLGIQWFSNGGRCGVCGDSYSAPQPRPNEAGGKYGLGIIVKNYTRGQVIRVQVEITANHLGYFEFRICPNNNPKMAVTEECLNRNLLTLEDGVSTRYYIKRGYLGRINVPVKLPENLVCTQCVLQWQYRGENNWGRCQNGRQGLGCGPQETFRACADVSISSGDTSVVIKEQTTPAPEIKTTRPPRPFTRRTTTRKPTPATRPPVTRAPLTTTTEKDGQKDGKNCRGLPEKLSQVPGLNFWCKVNCAAGHCPPTLCIC